MMEFRNKEIKMLEELIQKRDGFKANRLADHLLEEELSDVRVLNLAARAKLLLGKQKEAKKVAEKACRKYTDNIEARYIFGYCCQKLGEYADASETYRYIIKKTPHSAFACFRLAESLKMDGKIEQSLEAYRNASELDVEGDIKSLSNKEILRLKEEN